MMASRSRSSVTTSSNSVSSIKTRPPTSRPTTTRSTRPRTALTSTGYGDNEIICAISESRGISPTVGISFVNISTSEAVLCQFTDTQTYARTCHKIKVFGPSEILYMATAADSKIVSIIMENLVAVEPNLEITSIDRKYWSESSGYEYVSHLSLPDDLESLKMSLSGSYFAVCCFSAVSAQRKRSCLSLILLGCQVYRARTQHDICRAVLKDQV